MRALIKCGAVICAILAIFAVSCSDNVRSDNENHTYNLYGGIVKNDDNNSLDISLLLLRDSANYSKATISVGDIVLDYDTTTGLYIANIDSSTAIDQGEYVLSIDDSSWLSFDYVDTVSYSTAISSLSLQEDRINAGGDEVQVLWQLALLNDGYVLSTVHEDSVYTGVGHAQVVDAGNNQATVLSDAFRMSGELDTGWYYIHVYAYTGSPFTDRNLPNPLPDVFLDNIDGLNIDGSFGAVIVSPPESVHVIIQTN